MRISNNKLYTVQAYLEGYRVSNEGEVFKNGKPIKQRIRCKCIDKKYETRYKVFAFQNRPTATHQLVAYQKFREEWLFGENIVRHLNNDSLDNSLDNIQLGSPWDNYHDRPLEARLFSLKKAHESIRKFSDDQIKEIRNSNKSPVELAKEYSCSPVAMRNIVKGRSYKHVK